MFYVKTIYIIFPRNRIYHVFYGLYILVSLHWQYVVVSKSVYEYSIEKDGDI